MEIALVGLHIAESRQSPRGSSVLSRNPAVPRESESGETSITPVPRTFWVHILSPSPCCVLRLQSHVYFGFLIRYVYFDVCHLDFVRSCPGFHLCHFSIRPAAAAPPPPAPPHTLTSYDYDDNHHHNHHRHQLPPPSLPLPLPLRLRPRQLLLPRVLLLQLQLRLRRRLRLLPLLLRRRRRRRLERLTVLLLTLPLPRLQRPRLRP